MYACIIRETFVFSVFRRVFHSIKLCRHALIKTNTQPERFMNKLHEHKVIKTVHDCIWQKVCSSKAD